MVESGEPMVLGEGKGVADTSFEKDSLPDMLGEAEKDEDGVAEDDGKEERLDKLDGEIENVASRVDAVVKEGLSLSLCHSIVGDTEKLPLP